MPDRWRSEWIPVILGLTVWAFIVSTLRPAHAGEGTDDGIYLVCAESLRNGTGYHLISHPGSPPCPRYPIGFPAILAMALRLTPGQPSLVHDIAVARAVEIIFGGIFFVATYILLRRLHVNATSSLLIVMAVAFHPATINLSVRALSDVPFAAMASVFLARWQTPAGRRTQFFDGCLAALATLIRSVGVTLLLTAFVVALRDTRRIRSVALLIAGFLCVFPPLETYSAHSGAKVISDHYAEAATIFKNTLGSRISWNLRMLNKMTTNELSSEAVSSKPVARLLGRRQEMLVILRAAACIVLLLAIARLFRVSWRRALPIWVYAAATAAVVIPTYINTRFFLALAPFVVLAAGTGVALLARPLRVSALAAKLTYAAILALALGAAGRLYWKDRVNGYWAEPWERTELDASLTFAKQKLEPDAVIASMRPETTFLYTGRQAVELIGDNERIQGHIDASLPKRWRTSFPDRPFYILAEQPSAHRYMNEDREMAALKANPCLTLSEVYRTPEDRYRFYSVTLKAR